MVPLPVPTRTLLALAATAGRAVVVIVAGVGTDDDEDAGVAEWGGEGDRETPWPNLLPVPVEMGAMPFLRPNLPVPTVSYPLRSLAAELALALATEDGSLPVGGLPVAAAGAGAAVCFVAGEAPAEEGALAAEAVACAVADPLPVLIVTAAGAGAGAGAAVLAAVVDGVPLPLPLDDADAVAGVGVATEMALTDWPVFCRDRCPCCCCRAVTCCCLLPPALLPKPVLSPVEGLLPPPLAFPFPFPFTLPLVPAATATVSTVDARLVRLCALAVAFLPLFPPCPPPPWCVCVTTMEGAKASSSSSASAWWALDERPSRVSPSPSLSPSVPSESSWPWLLLRRPLCPWPLRPLFEEPVVPAVPARLRAALPDPEGPPTLATALAEVEEEVAEAPSLLAAAWALASRSRSAERARTPLTAASIADVLPLPVVFPLACSGCKGTLVACCWGTPLDTRRPVTTSEGRLDGAVEDDESLVGGETETWARLLVPFAPTA